MILALESLFLIAILSVGFISSQPKPVIPLEVTEQESERNTGACDAAGGDWNDCTMQEMRRVLMP